MTSTDVLFRPSRIGSIEPANHIVMSPDDAQLRARQHVQPAHAALVGAGPMAVGLIDRSASSTGVLPVIPEEESTRTRDKSIKPTNPTKSI